MTSREHTDFMKFLKKVNERLIIVTQHNVAQGLDPCDTDVLMLEEMYEWYVKSSLPWADVNEDVSVSVTQPEIFQDNSAVKN